MDIGAFASGVAGGINSGMSIKQVMKDKPKEPEAKTAADATAMASAEKSTGAMGMPTNYQGYSIQQPQAAPQPAAPVNAGQSQPAWGYLSSLINGGQNGG